ncbi:MAG: patatin-like phospholipase family protein [Xanthomonadales bacterium]|nr:patatin-like phospholipase family protein [Xanthomonadales bacterium]
MRSYGTPPKIGLALGSGASRGWSHIGIIKALLREGIEPDIICGTSVGAMIGACYLAGNLVKLENWVLGSTRTDVFKFFNVKLGKSGFVDSDRLSRFLYQYVAGQGCQIENLHTPFAAVSTDLESGREVWLQEGELADTVRASMALPGLFPAVRHEHRWLVDGGLVNPVPVSACRALGADVVIAVNLNSDVMSRRNQRKPVDTPVKKKSVLHNLKQTTLEYSNSIFPDSDKQEDAPGLFTSITASINIVQDRITRSRLAGDPAEVVISPRLGHIGLLEFHKAAEAIAEGENRVLAALADIRRVKELVEGNSD